MTLSNPKNIGKKTPLRKHKATYINSDNISLCKDGFDILFLITQHGLSVAHPASPHASLEVIPPSLTVTLGWWGYTPRVWVSNLGVEGLLLTGEQSLQRHIACKLNHQDLTNTPGTSGSPKYFLH